MSFWKTKIVKTRKLHRCAFCGSVIPVKFNAEYNTGLHDGEFQSYYFCMFCKEFTEKYECDLADGFSTGEMYDYIDETCTCNNRLHPIKHDIKEGVLEFDYDDCEIVVKMSYEEFFKRGDKL